MQSNAPYQQAQKNLENLLSGFASFMNALHGKHGSFEADALNAYRNLRWEKQNLEYIWDLMLQAHQLHATMNTHARVTIEQRLEIQSLSNEYTKIIDILEMKTECFYYFSNKFVDYLHSKSDKYHTGKKLKRIFIVYARNKIVEHGPDEIQSFGFGDDIGPTLRPAVRLGSQRRNDPGLFENIRELYTVSLPVIAYLEANLNQFSTESMKIVQNPISSRDLKE